MMRKFRCGLVLGALAIWVLAVIPGSAKEPTAKELYVLGVQAAERHEVDKAIALMQRCIKLEPKALSAYINLATFYGRDKKNLTKAEATMRQALSIAPNDFECQYEYAQILVEQNRFAMAKRILCDAQPRTEVERQKRDKQVKEIADYLRAKQIK